MYVRAPVEHVCYVCQYQVLSQMDNPVRFTTYNAAGLIYCEGAIASVGVTGCAIHALHAMTVTPPREFTVGSTHTRSPK